MGVDSELLKKTREFAEKELSNGEFEKFPYHNLKHTQEVVDAVIEVGEKSDLSEEDMEVALLAAWLHDVGYKNDFRNHEDESIKITREFLGGLGVTDSKVESVVRCIEATKMPQRPKSMVEMVMADADLYHLSTDLFFEKSELMRLEMAQLEDKELDQQEWLTQNIQFLKEHSYFTNYGQLVLEPNKAKNLKQLRKQNKKAGTAEIDSKYLKKLEKDYLKLKNRMILDKEKTPTRGIETMFRITSRNHISLSAMADNKANIMISVNSIILSILVSTLFRRFEDSPNLVIPAVILTLSALLTIVFAILATRPNISKGVFTRQDILNKKTNLVFFGNFHGMDPDMYEWGMKEMMKDQDYLYGSLIRDIYFLGAVLGKKYKLLRTSYTIFMYGFILSVFIFILATIFPNVFIL